MKITLLFGLTTINADLCNGKAGYLSERKDLPLAQLGNGYAVAAFFITTRLEGSYMGVLA